MFIKIKKTNHLSVYIIPLVIIVTFIGLLLNFYQSNHLIVSGEGSYFLNYPQLFKKSAYVWSEYGSGRPGMSVNYGYVFHLIALQTLIPDQRVINLISISSIYLLPFIVIYLLATKYKLKPFFALLISLIYITNPFMVVFLSSINQWNMLAAYILPAMYLIIYHYYQNPLKLFFIFGIHSLLFAFASANTPTAAIYLIAMPIFVTFISIDKEKTFNFKKIIFKYLNIFIAFILFNLWWLIIWIYLLNDAQAEYTKSYAMNWLIGSGKFVPNLWKSISLTGLFGYPVKLDFDYFSGHFNSPIGPLFVGIPFLLIIILFIKKKTIKTIQLLLTILLIVSTFLSKGINYPFGGIYEFLVYHFPFFYIFKSAGEKWGILTVFIFVLWLIYILKTADKKILKYFTPLLITYLIFCLFPFISNNFLPDAKIDTPNGEIIHSYQYLDKPEYQVVKNNINQDKNLYRVLSFPGSINYQVALRTLGNKYYTGNDPILNNLNKEFIAVYNFKYNPIFISLYDNLDNPNYLKLLPYFNIQKIIINKDMFPWFGYREKQTTKEIEAVFDPVFNASNNSTIDVYDTGNYFLPKFFIPLKIYQIQPEIDSLIQKMEEPEYQIRSAFFYANDMDKSDTIFPKIPNITFTKINPTRYTLRINAATDPYLLVFSESFHPDWKLYLNNDPSLSPASTIISKSYFNGQIQEGSHQNVFWDFNFLNTLTAKPVANGRHLMINSYANAWLIEPNDVNNLNNYELIVEYHPQRWLYFGLLITIITFISSTLLLRHRLKSIKYAN
jgi:hypothetical protein